MVPEALTFDTELSDRGHRLYAALLRYGATSGRRYPADETIAERWGVSPKTVRRARADLVARGWVTVTARPGRSNLVRLHEERRTVDRSDRGQNSPGGGGQICPGWCGHICPPTDSK